MNKHSGKLVALQSLITPLNEEFDKIHNAWESQPSDAFLAEKVVHFHQLGNVLFVADLGLFSKLAHLLVQACQRILDAKIERNQAHKLLFASQLLQYELNRFILTGNKHPLLLSLRTSQISSWLGVDEGGVLDQLSLERFSQKIASVDDLLNEEPLQVIGAHGASIDELYLAWQVACQSLVALDENDDALLTKLSDIARQMIALGQSHTQKKLWYLCHLWLGSLVNNDNPKPSLYLPILNELEEVFLLERNEIEALDVVLWLENLLIDIYIQMGSLTVSSDEAYQFLASLSFRLTNEAMFFPYILGILEGMLFAFARGEMVEGVLEEVETQLESRGWTFYKSYARHIIDDIKTAKSDPELLMQMQWQINTQLQDLYTAISNTHQSIIAKIGEGAPLSVKEAPQELRRVRRLIEMIKVAFNDYLHKKEVERLPESKLGDELGNSFEEIGFHQAKSLSVRIFELFDALKVAKPSQLSWSFAHAATEGLSLFELFLDGLVKEIFDEALLTRADEQIGRALTLLSQPNGAEAMVSFETIYDGRVRYDDSGEIAPNASKFVITVQETADEQTASEQAVSTLTDNSAPEMMPDTAHHSTNDLSGQAFSVLNQASSNSSQINTQTKPLSESYLAARALLKPDGFDFDEDIRDIFVEEAQEVVEDIQARLPSWQARIDSRAPLKEIRRGFHTLKGSGRMVNAFSVGEMAWAVENLLNRVLDGVIAPSQALSDFIGETTAKIPTLVADFKAGRQPSIDPAVIILKANNLLAQKDVLDGVPEEPMPLVHTKADDVPIAIGDILSDDAIRLDGIFAHTPDLDAPKLEILEDALADRDDLSDADALEVSTLDASTTHTNDADAIHPQPSSHPSMDDDAKPMDSAMQTADEEVLSVGGQGADELPSVLLSFYEDAKAPKVSQVGEVDDDIKEIYIEEATEVLESITPLYDEWVQTRDKDALIEIRRGFHTLKGSGRMVGAATLGELAWAVENLLNRVLDETIEMDFGMTALVGDVLADFQSLIGIFARDERDYPDSLALRVAAAHAYSKGHGGDFDYRDLWCCANAGVADASITTAALDADGVQADAPSDEASDTKLLSIIQEVKAVIVSAEPVAPVNEEEDELCQIFIEEARELLAMVRTFLMGHDGNSELVVNDDVVRAFHTLKGAKGLLPLAAVGEVGAMMEDGLRHLQSSDELMSQKHLKALGSSVELIESYLTAYENKTANDGTLQAGLADNKQLIEGLLYEGDKAKTQFEVASLIEGIDTLLDAELEFEVMLANEPEMVATYAKTLHEETELLKTRTTQSKKFQSLLSALASAFALLHKAPVDALDDDFVAAMMAALGELTGLFDSLAGSMSLRLDALVVDRLNDKVAERAGRDMLLGESPAPAVPEVEFIEIDTDPELLEIFLEEALELDYAIDKAFSEWREDIHNTEALKALQRHLHTIKGGTRLVGIASIGNLTHEAESVYERLINGRLLPSETWVRIMQSIQDLLSMQLKEVRQNNRSFEADYAIDALKAYSELSVLPEDAKIALPILEETQTPEEALSVVPEVAIQTTDAGSDFEERRRHSWQGAMPDKDILAVFLEEAEELVETSLEDFQVFRSNTGDLATLQSLQRKLHTIKGGARMVSANGLADLAHNMETVYEDLGNRRRPATKMVIGLLLACHDWITGAIALLKANYNPPSPQALIDVLESFSRNPDSLESIPVVSLADELQALAVYTEYQRGKRGGYDISTMPPSEGMFKEAQESTHSNEMIRISANLMERMVNLSGEAAINRARIDMSMASLTVSIEEMGATIQRLHDQLRRMDIELEAQILAQIDDKSLLESGEFDPLEMDQYSSLNQLSKSLSESASDLLDLKSTLLEKTRDSENLLLQLSRTHTDLQDGLMYSRMVPFSRLTPRLERIARQVSSELGKQVELTVINADDEMDRTILERITSPLEHMLRNAIDHGIEMPEEREVVGKASTGQVKLEVVREGSEILIHLTDDGAGINVEAVRKKAIAQGLIAADDKSLSDLDIMQYIFNAGLSTTSVITQISGRGVGMDVVRSEIQQLGGSVSVESERGKGSRFTMRVPLTVAVSDTLVVRAADRHYAVPLVQIDRVVQVSSKALLAYHQSSNATLDIGGEPYRLRYLNDILLGHNFSETMATTSVIPVILVKNQAGQNLALQVDEIIGSRIEVVVKPLGRQLAHVSGISSATIMGDGSVMFILDLMALIRNARARVAVQTKAQEVNKRPVILVVDDSVTVRKVTSRFLEREGFEAVVAKDGVDAIEMLQDLKPDLMLLDIEMPRMDGFEVAAQVRHNARLADLPIIMITSRTGEKHRERAFEIGVNDYMGKPFQENELLARIYAHLTVSK